MTTITKYVMHYIAGKFGRELNLPVRTDYRQIKVRQYFLHTYYYIRMAILYRTAKF